MLGEIDMVTPVLDSNRLVLRPFKKSDANDVYKCWESDPDVAKYMFWTSHNDINKTKEWIDFEIGQIENEGWYRFALVLKENNELIGTVILYYDDEVDCYEIGYNLGKEYWGKGYGTEAVSKVIEFAIDKLGITEIVGRFAKENIASGKLLYKVGFIYEKDIDYECNDGKIVREGIQCRKFMQKRE